MGKITDIAPQKRNKSRVSVFIDGEFACGLDALSVAKARIKIGDEIEPDKLAEVAFDSELNGAFDRAADYLSREPRTAREVERKLADKGYDKKVIDCAVERLKGYGYIDDGEYAALFIKSKSDVYGRFRLRVELKKRGVDDAIIDEKLSVGDDENAEFVARKYMRAHPSADKQKLKRFLFGRGFSWDAISSAVELIFDGDDFSASDEYYED